MEPGTVLWAEAAVAVLPEPIFIEETFCYALPEECLRLEEFRLSLSPFCAENRGAVVSAETEVLLLALFLSGSGRCTLHRREWVRRRVPMKRFSFASAEEETGSSGCSLYWRAAASSLRYFPDCACRSLTVQLSFFLTLCGTVQRLVPLQKVDAAAFAGRESAPDFQKIQAEMTELRQALSICREEIASLKYQLKHPKNTVSCSPNPAAVHKLT